MPIFPQPVYQTTAVSATSHTANSGDVIAYTPTAASTLNLPANPTEGAIVIVVNLAAFAVTVKTTDSTTINGASGSTGVAVASGGTGASMTKGTFVFDGSAWYGIA